MRGVDAQPGASFSYISTEGNVPADRPFASRGGSLPAPSTEQRAAHARSGLTVRCAPLSLS